MKPRRWPAIVGIALVMLAGAVPAASPAAAATPGDDNSAVCVLSFTERFTPGFTLTASSGFQGSANPGTIMCLGKVQGHEVTGPGTIRNEGSYTDSTCLLDHAEGWYSFTVPTTAGEVTVSGSFVVVRVGPALTVHLEHPGALGSGSAVVVPTRGDCVLAPITEALVLMSVGFRDSGPVATSGR